MEESMDLERDVILVDVVPLLKADLLGARSRLGRDELLEVPDGVVGVALDPHLLAQAVVAHHLNHPACLSQPLQYPDDPAPLAWKLSPPQLAGQEVRDKKCSRPSLRRGWISSQLGMACLRRL